MILGIDQYGDKAIMPDAKVKTLLKEYGCNSATPIFRDGKDNKPVKVGYRLTCKGYVPL